MVDNENSEQLLTSYFEKAGKEAPVVPVSEINNLISTLPVGAISASLTNKTIQQVLAQYKYWLAGGLSICTGALLLFTSSKQDLKINSATISNVKPPAIKNINQDAAQTISTENYTVIEKKGTEKEVAVLNKITEKNKIQASPKESLAEISKKSSYYFPGDARVNFELNGQSISMIIREQVEQLEINGVQIDKNDFSEYAAIIEKGKALKMESDRVKFDKKDAENLQQLKNREIMHGLIDELNADQMIDKSGNFEFRISVLKLYINNMEQAEIVSAKYIKLYESLSGNQLTEKSNIRIKH